MYVCVFFLSLHMWWNVSVRWIRHEKLSLFDGCWCVVGKVVRATRTFHEIQYIFALSLVNTIIKTFFLSLLLLLLLPPLAMLFFWHLWAAAVAEWFLFRNKVINVVNFIWPYSLLLLTAHLIDIHFIISFVFACCLSFWLLSLVIYENIRKPMEEQCIFFFIRFLLTNNQWWVPQVFYGTIEIML